MEYPVPQIVQPYDVVTYEPIEVIQQEKPVSTGKPFIEANTEETTIEEIKENHIIPVFVKDNEPCISHYEFIEAAHEMASSVFDGEVILRPSVRVSHPIKGRIPEARNKPANTLMEYEKTIYYERMAFIIEVPGISANVGGNELSLTIGGVKAYNLDNMYAKKGVDEQFKVFIGFQNKVCANTCIWSDGYIQNLRVSSINQLRMAIYSLINSYNQNMHLFHMQELTKYSITEQQFANLIGRARMYNYLPADRKKDITPILLNDTQIAAVVKDYHKDRSFCKDVDGNINLWKLYNLFTGCNKSSYIDTFLDRSVSVYNFTEQIRYALEERSSNWYLN